MKLPRVVTLYIPNQGQSLDIIVVGCQSAQGETIITYVESGCRTCRMAQVSYTNNPDELILRREIKNVPAQDFLRVFLKSSGRTLHLITEPLAGCENGSIFTGSIVGHRSQKRFMILGHDQAEPGVLWVRLVPPTSPAKTPASLASHSAAASPKSK